MRKTRHRRPPCSKQGKKRYPTKADALEGISRKERVYRCTGCRGFHRTTTPVGIESAKRR